MKELEHVDGIARRIHLVRGKKVMLDMDLAELYGVETGQLNRAVKRNIDRFPIDFMFRLTIEEHKSLLCQIGIAKRRGGRHNRIHVFAQEGAAMLSSVLRSPRAAKVNIAIMRAFVRVREVLGANRELAEKIEELEKKYEGHDERFQVVFEALRGILRAPERPKRRIGFLEESMARYSY